MRIGVGNTYGGLVGAGTRVRVGGGEGTGIGGGSTLVGLGGAVGSGGDGFGGSVVGSGVGVGVSVGVGSSVAGGSSLGCAGGSSRAPSIATLIKNASITHRTTQATSAALKMNRALIASEYTTI